MNKLNHLAIIMDGNGRWAKERGLDRTKGHLAGADVVREITKYCAKTEIKYLTLYAFSTENWKRPKLEIKFLMNLLDKYLEKELDNYMENDVKFETIGDISVFSSKLIDRINYTKEKTKNNSSLIQILALNYGSRDEIIRAMKRLVDNNDTISEENLQKYLDTKDFCDVDLLIRTSGEIRVSNFLLWQIAYSEMYFTNTLWPDFTTSELEDIINDFKYRNRRFGGI